MRRDFDNDNIYRNQEKMYLYFFYNVQKLTPNINQVFSSILVDVVIGLMEEVEKF